jgi:hypothetical protein
MRRKDPVPAIAYNPTKKTSDDYAIDNSSRYKECLNQLVMFLKDLQ